MTQVTTPDNIPSPDLTDQYALTQDMAALADGTQRALTRRANMYVGTANQRIAFTTAIEGVHWQDTDGVKAEYVRKSGKWEAAIPVLRLARGGFTAAQNSSGRTQIQFPDNLFTSPPTVLLTLRSFKVNGFAAITSDPITTTSAFVNTFNVATGANNPGIAVDWVAFGG